MSNSRMVDMVNYSPNHSGRRTHPISKIAIHHTAGVVTARTIGNIFKPVSRQASCNYGIGNDNKVILCVDERNRSWCTSSSWCDNRAITIEVSNSTRNGWKVSDTVLNTLIELVTDICKRNGIKKCTYTGGKDGVLQMHKWYSWTTCPGPYLASKFPYIAREVNKRLNGKVSSKASSGLYRVRKTWADSKSQKGAFKNLDGAIKTAKKNGYKVFDEAGTEVYPTDKRGQGKLIKDEKWHGITQTACNVRSKPSINAPVVATYGKGQKINYDKVYEGDGYRWISYKADKSGNRRYVAYRRLSGDKRPWIKF